MHPFIITDTSLTVLVEGVPQTILDNHPNFPRVRDALRDSDWETVVENISIANAVQTYVCGHLVVEDGQVFYQGHPLHNSAVDRLMTMMSEGFDVEYLVAFLAKVCENPDSRAVDGLYSWLEKGGLPLTKEGDILGYKIVRDDFRDFRSGEYDNSPGQILSMPRFACDADPDRTCSTGLHFCSAEYLPAYGTWSDRRIVLVKINPRDVVAFPHDYNISKGRCCRYEVVQEIPAANAEKFFEGSASIFTAV